MKCPKCEVKLEVMERDGHVGFCCSECSGVLLTERYLSTLNFKPENSANKFYACLVLGLTESTNCKCPTCKKPMYISVYENVELDFCNGCKSVWFDFSELGETLTSFKSPKVGASTYTKSDFFAHASEVILRLF